MNLVTPRIEILEDGEIYGKFAVEPLDRETPPTLAGTGSAAGPLALHLARHGAVPFGEEIEIRQGEELGRSSFLYASAHGTSEAVQRIEVGGCAVVVARGEFALPGAG